jgi:hypothetical protein
VSLVVCWYTLHGQPAADVAARRAMGPWYRAKHAVSFADMHLALRRVILARSQGSETRPCALSSEDRVKT